MAKKKELEDWQREDARRLDSLFKARARVNQTEFGVRYEIGTQGMVWQYLSGTRALNIKAAEAFARGLNINIDEFSPTIADHIRSAAVHVRDTDWPFTAIDKKKLSAIQAPQLEKLENAFLDAATGLGLDIKKD